MPTYSSYTTLAHASTAATAPTRSPKLHLYFHTPVAIFKARVNMPTPTYPANSLDFDGVTLGAYTDVEFDMTLTLGTTEGGDDLGRVRVKTSEVDNIRIARSSRGVEDGTLEIVDNAYITVWDIYQPWARLPYFSLDDEGDVIAGEDFKDGDIEPGDYNENIPPVANTGPWVADYVDPDTGEAIFEFPAGGADLSFPMAEGATLVTWNWDIQDGSFIDSTAADAVITASFPAGFRWISLTVVDSNDKPHTSRCAVLTVDKDDDVTLQKFKISQRMERSGQTLDVDIFEDIPRSVYPDGTLVLFWIDAPESATDRSHMKFCGWVANESSNISRGKTGLRKTTTIHCEDITTRLTSLPGFPQALERFESDSLWSVMPDLDMKKALVYLYYWHCNAMNLADFILPDYLTDYVTVRLDASGGSLFGQMDNQAQKIEPDHFFTCNTKGQMVVRRDWMLDDVVDRPAVAHTITIEEWNNLQPRYNRHPKVHVLRSGALLCDTDFVTIEGEETIALVFSHAPGISAAFGQGINESTHYEALALSQDDLNKHEGHRYARLNARYEPFPFTDPTGYQFWNYEPAEMGRIQLEMDASVAAQRGLDWSSAAGMVKDITVNYEVNKQGLVIKPSINWEKETYGFPAVTYIPPDSKEHGYEPDPGSVPPVDEFPAAPDWVAAIDQEGKLYRTFNFSSATPNWEEIDLGITDVQLRSFVVDPFSPGYIDGDGAINSWVVGETNLWHITDMFGFAAATIAHTFATTIDATSQDMGRTIQASFGKFTEDDNPWVICVSHYHDTSGHEGTWATYSIDAGVTWSTEVQVSAEFDVATPTRPTQVGVYASPKTPGLAYTAAWSGAGEGANPSPLLAVINVDTSSILSQYIGSSMSLNLHVHAKTGVSLDDSGLHSLVIAPPENAVRMVIQGSWVNTVTVTSDPWTSFSTTCAEGEPGSFTKVEDLAYTSPPGTGGATSDTFTVEWTRGGGETEWPGSREEFEATPPTTDSGYCHIRMQVIASKVGLSQEAINDLTVAFTVTEIELEDTTIYDPSGVAQTQQYKTTDWGATFTVDPLGVIQPGLSLASGVHLPWPTNDDESISFHGRLEADTVLNYKTFRSGADVSPSDVGLIYGIARYGFGIRTFDDDRTYVVMGGVANDTSLDTADNQYAVFVSDDDAATFTKVLGPIDDSDFSVVKGYGVAFSGSDRNLIFVWGPKQTAGAIRFSDDFGATFDDKTGDLPAIAGFLGIAGGPS